MKCIRESSTGKILRTMDSEAKRLVDGNFYVYCKKSEWKKNPWKDRKYLLDGKEVKGISVFRRDQQAVR